MSISKLPPELKPREKAIAQGIASLSDVELLALILQSGYHNCDALDLAKQILEQLNGLSGLLKANPIDLKIKGIKKAKSLKLLAVAECCKRIFSASQKFQEKYKNPFEIPEVFGRDLRYQDREILRMVMLDKNHRLIQSKDISQNDEKETKVNVVNAVKAAINASSSYVYLLHNHPSGICKPSEDDIIATKIIKTNLAIIGVNLLDHFIVSGDKYYSFAGKNSFSFKKNN